MPDAQLLFVGATPAKVRRLRRLGVLDRCTLLEPTLDEARLAAFYAACDVFVSASEIGEAQGLANLEAMSFGVPVVTCSMPWADNAQVEFVEHGRTGLIANHPRPFAEAVAALLLDAKLRERLGAEARATVARRFDPRIQARQLERLFTGLLNEGRVPSEWAPSLGRGGRVRTRVRPASRAAVPPAAPRGARRGAGNPTAGADGPRGPRRSQWWVQSRPCRWASRPSPAGSGSSSRPVESLLGPDAAAGPDLRLPAPPFAARGPRVQLAGWLQRPPAGVRLVAASSDYGPGTKLLGCLPHRPPTPA